MFYCCFCRSIVVVVFYYFCFSLLLFYCFCCIVVIIKVDFLIFLFVCSLFPFAFCCLQFISTEFFTFRYCRLQNFFELERKYSKFIKISCNNTPNQKNTIKTPMNLNRICTVNYIKIVGLFYLYVCLQETVN